MKRILLSSAALAALLGTTSAMADEAMAKAKNCLACHQTEKKVVGPAYKEVAKKYAGDAGAVDLLAEHILKGSSGTWGPIPMPPNANVNPDEAKQLATWIMSLQ